MTLGNETYRQIFRYLNRQMSGDERYAFEREMQKDPFLRDAVEGFERFDAPLMQNDLDELDKQLKCKKPQKKAILMAPRLKWAAAILLLLGIGSIILMTLMPFKPTQPLAEQNAIKESAQQRVNEETATVKKEQESELRTQTEAKPVTQKKAEPLAPNPLATPITIAEADSELDTSKTNYELAEADVPDDSGTIVIAANETTESINMAKPAAGIQIADAEMPAEKTVSVQAKTSAKKQENQSQMVVKGKVFDAENLPIVGASVTIKNTSIGTITDLDGNFNISANSNQILVVSFIGYLTEEVKAEPNVTVNLTEDLLALDEVVVVGYGTSRWVREPSEPKPEGGLKAFRKYVDDHKTINLNGLTKVELEFYVDANGQLSQIKALESPSDEFTAEAIRLLTNGPKWKADRTAKKNGPQRGTVVIWF